jgi:transposase InsO family protein
VQVAFSLDCCDREVMSYVATTAAITGEMIRDIMAESVERRFGAEALGTPHPVEWLSDNGPPYTALDTRATASDRFLRKLTDLDLVERPDLGEVDSNRLADAGAGNVARLHSASHRVHAHTEPLGGVLNRYEGGR